MAPDASHVDRELRTLATTAAARAGERARVARAWAAASVGLPALAALTAIAAVFAATCGPTAKAAMAFATVAAAASAASAAVAAGSGRQRATVLAHRLARLHHDAVAVEGLPARTRRDLDDKAARADELMALWWELDAELPVPSAWSAAVADRAVGRVRTMTRLTGIVPEDEPEVSAPQPPPADDTPVEG